MSGQMPEETFDAAVRSVLLRLRELYARQEGCAVGDVRVACLVRLPGGTETTTFGFDGVDGKRDLASELELAANDYQIFADREAGEL